MPTDKHMLGSQREITGCKLSMCLQMLLVAVVVAVLTDRAIDTDMVKMTITPTGILKKSRLRRMILATTEHVATSQLTGNVLTN